MKHHEENVDLRLLSRVAKIDSRMKVIQITYYSKIGLKTWGRIDFLCNINLFFLFFLDFLIINFFLFLLLSCLN